MTKVISFSSGKGGVGKSTLVSNLGVQWAAQGKRVLLIDGDWALGKLGLMFNHTPKHTIYDVLNGNASILEAVQPLRENLYLLSAPSGVVGFEELGDTFRNQLFYELEELADQFDLILLDHSSGVHWNVIQFAGAAHQHVIISTTEPTSYTDAYAIMKILSKRFAVRQFHLLVTMEEKPGASRKVVERFAEVTLKHLQVHLKYLGVFPWDARFGEAVRQQRTFVSMFPNSETAAKFKQVCQKLDRANCHQRNGLQFFYRQSINLKSLAR